MNNKMLKITVFILLCMPWPEYARVMSPGVAQAELNRMIRDAKRNPPSEQKMKQLLNDISPSLKEEYQDLLNEVNSKKISAKEKDDEVINVNVALGLLKGQIEEVNSKEEALKLMEVLASEENLKFDENTAREFTALAKDLIENQFSEIEKEKPFSKDKEVTKGKESDEKLDTLEFFSEENEEVLKNDDQMKKKQKELENQEKEIREQQTRMKEQGLSNFLKNLVNQFKKNIETKDKNLIIVLPPNYKISTKNEESDFSVEVIEINKFFKAFEDYAKDKDKDIHIIENGFVSFFNAITFLVQKASTCDQILNLYEIMKMGNTILNHSPGWLQGYLYGKFADKGPYNTYQRQMTDLNKKINQKKCNSKNIDLIKFD